jgi:CelD/BcsL family acetyltransferase involved in cellulose biosynthesis
MMERAIRYACGRGLARYELLGDAEPYKRRWTRETVDHCVLEMFAPRPAGLAELAAFRGVRPVVRRARARLATTAAHVR